MTTPAFPKVSLSAVIDASTLADIKSARDAANGELSDYEDVLLTEFGKLRDKIRVGGGWDQLSDDDKLDYNKLSAAIDEVQHAMVVLAMITLQSINQSHEVRDIANSLNAIADDLKKTATTLTKIQQAVATAAQVAAVVVSVAQKLGALAAAL